MRARLTVQVFRLWPMCPIKENGMFDHESTLVTTRLSGNVGISLGGLVSANKHVWAGLMKRSWGWECPGSRHLGDERCFDYESPLCSTRATNPHPDNPSIHRAIPIAPRAARPRRPKNTLRARCGAQVLGLPPCQSQPERPSPPPAVASLGTACHEERNTLELRSPKLVLRIP